MPSPEEIVPAPARPGRRLAIVTRTLMPGSCGIADYSLEFARALCARGEVVRLFGGRVSGAGDAEGIGDDWDTPSLARAMTAIQRFTPDNVVLQYTPQMYCSPGRSDSLALESFWSDCGERWSTVLTVHETYFRPWWYPPSWRQGTSQKHRLERLVRSSRTVFSASEPLVREMMTWTGGTNVHYLPIGSNFQVASGGREEWRAARGIGPESFVLTLFGGGTSLRWLSGHVDTVDARLRRAGVAARWVLLGGVPEGWFDLRSPTHTPGRVTDTEISKWLQASDLFLMPHQAGVCGKRGTLMAAMQHGLPVAGTRGTMTDAFWSSVPGVMLTPIWSRRGLAEAVLEMARDGTRRKALGTANRSYFLEHFTWDAIASRFTQLAR